MFSLAADAIVLASLLAPRHFHVLLGYGESLVAQMRPNLSSRNVDEQILDLAALVADGAPLAGYRLAANFPKLAYHIMSRWLDRDEHADVEGQLRALIRAAIYVDSQTRPVRDIWRHVFSMIYGSERSGKTRASAKMKTKTKAKTIRRGDGPGGLSRIRASLLACAFSACVTAIRATDDVSAISSLDKSAEDAGEQELVALVSAYTDYMEGAHEHATEGGVRGPYWGESKPWRQQFTVMGNATARGHRRLGVRCRPRRSTAPVDSHSCVRWAWAWVTRVGHSSMGPVISGPCHVQIWKQMSS